MVKYGSSRALRTIVFAIMFAGAFSYFSNPVAFEYRLNQIESGVNEFVENTNQEFSSLSQTDSREKLLCANNEMLLDVLNNGEFQNLDGTFQNYDLGEIDLANYKVVEGRSDVLSFECRKGSKEGERTDFYYCSEKTDPPIIELKYERVEDDVVQETGSVGITRFVVAENRTIMKATCEASLS